MLEKTTDDWQRTWHHLQQGLGNKWALHVLHVLATDAYSFSGLKREIDGISETMLSRRLSDLMEKGFIEKSTLPTTPPRTLYELTAAGERVATFLEEMEQITALAETSDGAQLLFEA
ncbi:helix-turn-helix domain-containing protein [Natrinema hispanicum]|uniref:HxlR-like helix-turn-helix n=1 Tax=Natrinema hispanicum TaxID=392421 RepID=A0A1G6YJ30_9EURY|nr:helix-turn-helix domain-containing protein [Natrinema hispanicum]SDD90003.1 HxlR-like helix-turn-helix [Natrinema hispanicum]